MNKKPNYFFSVTEARRLTGIDKKGIYNRCKKGIPLTKEIRKGRKFAEAVIPLEGIVAMFPNFAKFTEERILMLFIVAIKDIFSSVTISKWGKHAFRVNELTRILGFSNQWIHKQLKAGKIQTVTARRYGRKEPEKLIPWTELQHLKEISFEELQKRVLELFELSWRFTEKNAYHSCRLGIGEFRAGRENRKFICPNCLASLED